MTRISSTTSARNIRIAAIIFLLVFCGNISWGQTPTSQLPGQKSTGPKPSSRSATCKEFPEPFQENDICIGTQGDTTTPKAISVPIVKMNAGQVTIAIGPLSPIESCTLTSVTSAPSTTTDQASLARLIGILLGGSVTAPPVPLGSNVLGTRNLSTDNIEQSPASKLLDAAKQDLDTAKNDFDTWKNRRQAAIDSLNNGQRLLMVAARKPDPRAQTADSGAKSKIQSQVGLLADCLNEEGVKCGDITAVNARAKLDAESLLQKVASNLNTAAGLLKTPTEPTCDLKKNKQAECDAAKSKYDDEYQNDLNRLFRFQAQLAGLQNDDTKLRAGEAPLSTLYSQANKVLQHVNSDNLYVYPPSGGLFATLTIVPSPDSDLTASVTCTNILDNSTTLGPVPISMHAGIPRFIFSAGGLISLTPTQTLGELPVKDTSTAGFHTIVQQTGSNRFQVIPFAFETFRLLPWKHLWHNTTITGVGITGGIGFNPYSGVQGIDFFSGGSIRFFDKIFLHCGLHSGRFVYLDSHSSLQIGDTLPATGFPATVPTVTRFTHHLAFGTSYSF